MMPRISMDAGGTDAAPSIDILMRARVTIDGVLAEGPYSS